LPSGRTHDRITFSSLPLVAFSTFWYSARADTVIWVSSAFLFSGLMFGPDLDLHSVQYLRWGRLRWIWRPYQKYIRHRSILSHGPIIGTIVRIIYLGWWLSLLGFLLLGMFQFFRGNAYNGGQIIEVTIRIAIARGDILFAGAIGLELGAMSHYLLDWLNSRYKSYQRLQRAKLAALQSRDR
jgi:uncharacterized metal-binding protein